MAGVLADTAVPEAAAVNGAPRSDERADRSARDIVTRARVVPTALTRSMGGGLQ
jgi:hypothetical protein